MPVSRASLSLATTLLMKAALPPKNSGHSCQKPAELAQWVLGWPADRVQQAMQSGGNNKQVNLPHKIPVYIVYFTAFVENGQLAFGNDLYERDNTLVSALAKVTVPNDTMRQAQEALRALAKG